jgi:hypothetical protein
VSRSGRAGRALPHTVRGPGAVLIVLLAGFLAGRLAIWSSGRIFTSYDTFSYAYRRDPFYNRGALVSFIGHAPRLWGAPMLYALFSDDRGRTFAQWATGTLAWAALAWALWTCLRGLPARILGSGLVLLLGLLTPVTNWDFAILSESLSISLGVLVLALLLRALSTGSRVALAGMTAAAVWWTFTRPDIRVLVVLLVPVLAGYAWRNRPRCWFAIGCAGMLVVAIAWCTAIMPAMLSTYSRYSATPSVGYDEGLLIYRLRLHILPDPQVKAIFEREFGMPTCAATDRIAVSPQWQTVEFVGAYNSCPALKAWGQRNAGDVYNRFALREPRVYARITVKLLGLSLAGANYAKPKVVVSHAVEKAAFPPSRYTVGLVFGGLAVALALAVVAGAHRLRRLLFWTGVAVAVASGISVLAGIVFGAGEYWRFGIQEAVGVRLAAIILLSASADASIERAGQRRQRRESRDTASTSNELGSGAVGTLAVVGRVLLAGLLLTRLLRHSAALLPCGRHPMQLAESGQLAFVYPDNAVPGAGNSRSPRTD